MNGLKRVRDELISKISKESLCIYLTVFFSLFFIRQILGIILQPSKGFDLTDEGLYLLSADPSGKYDYSTWPFGWSTHLLFAFSKYNIADFRLNGALILFCASGYLGWSALNFVLSTEERKLKSTKAKLFEFLLIVISSSIASLYYYSGFIPFLRTPSYNWVNLLGIIMIIAGVLNLGYSIRANGKVQITWQNCSYFAFTSLGLFITVPAKPSTAPLMLILVFIFLVLVTDVVNTVRALIFTLFGLLFWILLSLIFGIWPRNFISRFINLLHGPYAVKGQTWRDAVSGLIHIPSDVSANFTHFPKIAIFLIAIGLITLLSKFRKFPELPIVGYLSTVLGSLLALGSPNPFNDYSDRSSEGVRFANLTTFWLCLTVASALFYIEMKPRIAKHLHGTPNARPTNKYTMLILFLPAPFVYAYGTSNGLLAESTMAVVFFVVMAHAFLHQNNILRVPLMLCLSLLLLITNLTVASTLVSQSSNHPYRSQPISTQVIPTKIGLKGSTLWLDEPLSNTITTLAKDLKRGGFKPNTPILNLIMYWAPGLTYALGGTSPSTIFIIGFGYPNSVTSAQYQLQRIGNTFDFTHAWIAKSVPSVVSNKDQGAFDEVLSLIAKRSGLNFPKDYTLITTVTGFEYWAPASK